MVSPARLPLLEVGAQAPEFELRALGPEGKLTVRLSDYKGKANVILAFYPKDNTPGCSREMCDFSDDLQSFADVSTVVLGISRDKIESHEKFASKYALKQILLVDDSGATGRDYGTVNDGANARRVLYVIDKEGIIRHVVEGMPDNQDLLQFLKHRLN